MNSRKSEVLRAFKKASALDAAGKAPQAEVEYRRIYTLGAHHLPTTKRPDFFLQYGSTLKNVGKHTESIRILKMGIRKFPRFRALKLFLALTYLSANKSKPAVQILLKDSMEHPDTSIRKFSRAISYYSKRLS